MKYKQFKKFINEVKGSRQRSLSDPTNPLINDQDFLQKVLDNKGVWIDDENEYPYFEEPDVLMATTFYTPDELSNEFAGGGGITIRQDLKTGEDFLSAGRSHRNKQSYDEKQYDKKKEYMSASTTFADDEEKKQKEDFRNVVDVGKFEETEEHKGIEKGEEVDVFIKQETETDQGTVLEPGMYSGIVAIPMAGNSLEIGVEFKDEDYPELDGQTANVYHDNIRQWN